MLVLGEVYFLLDAFPTMTSLCFWRVTILDLLGGWKKSQLQVRRDFQQVEEIYPPKFLKSKQRGSCTHQSPITFCFPFALLLQAPNARVQKRVPEQKTSKCLSVMVVLRGSS